MMDARDEFSEMVMSWSLEDIFNEDLYRNQVEKIPDTFVSVPQYLGSFEYPLLEETRAELASKLETIHDAPFSNVTSFCEVKKFGKGAYRVDVDYWRNKRIDHGKETYKTLPGDIFIISSAKPESVSDLQRSGFKWTFASVKKITNKIWRRTSKDRDEPKDEPLDFVVQILKGCEFEILQRPLFVVYVTNITTNKRIWSSLHMDTGSNIIEEALLRSHLDEENIHCNKCSSADNSCSEDYCYPGLVSSLNDSQIGAICSSLQKLNCDHKCSAQLIWGPPGTGKTKTLSVLLFVLLQMNIRTVVCAPTNIAVKEVASRVLSIVRESLKSANNNRPLSLSRILLLGNDERLKVHGDDIEQIYLNHRVERLYECFGEEKGWKISVCCMIDFLKNPFSGCHDSEELDITETDELGAFFLKVLKEKFEFASSPLRRRISAVFTHLQTSLISEQNAQDMVKVLSLLDLIDGCLVDTTVAKELEELFSHGDTMEHASIVFESSTSVSVVRKECLSLLKNLLCAFEKIPILCKDTVEKLCFQSASLIFCTASTSYNLQFKDMEPIKLLVIDEAAQLKESESCIPLQLPDVRHVTLIGDECQLPALVNSKVAGEAEFGRSLFERLSLIGFAKQLLNIQYRMHPSISCFPNSAFYSNKIIDAQYVKNEAHLRNYIPGDMFGPYSFINVENGMEEVDDVSHSRRNFVEVAMVVKLVQNLYRAWKTSPKEMLSIGVISPYAAQVEAIKGKLCQTYPDGFTVNVKSVDGFQGGEQDIIILSTVRSNAHGSIGFLSNWQRTNVALTRARHCLWILGNEGTLRKSLSVWSSLVHDAQARGCLFDAHQDEGIKKIVLEVKKELDQLDDLLNENSVLFSSARWKVIFSHNFRKSFSKLKSSRVRKTILHVLLKLACGWRPQRSTVDIVCDRSRQTIKQFLVEGKYIVCTNEITKEIKYTQVLKVWDLMALEEIPKFINRLDNIFCMYTDNYISCCNEKYSEGKIEIPMSWEASYDIIQFKTVDKDGYIGELVPGATTVVENSSINESLLLMKFYSLSSLTASYLLSEQSGIETDLPFEVTDEEWEVIKFNKSAFVLGRSGTGKTTILTMKLFHKEQLQHLVSEGFESGSFSTPALWSGGLVDRVTTGGTVLRQIFVTVSPKLCRAVKKHITDLVRFTHGETLPSENISTELDDLDETVLLEDIPDSFIHIAAEKYPLVITFHKFLLMLDRSIGVSYFSRFQSIAELAVNSIAFQNFVRTREVNFERFCSAYWPHFNRTLTKSLDPLRVFTEIISHIKGSFKGAGGGRVLSLEDYVLLSCGRTSTLTSKMREEIYFIFQSYEKMKMRNYEFDVADIVIDLHHRLEKEEGLLQSPKMDFVYIDEVQDLTMSQISLFKHICSNVEEGFVFSGDTAQTIARGIDFRFEDIRSLFYNNFLMGSQGDSARRAEKGLITDTFNLRRNFRTHTGVLMLAQSVIRLLYHFFPQSIDILKPETSLIYGENPVLLEPCSDENAILSIFGNVKGSGSAMVGFGAEQVILVRDDDVKQEVCKHVGGKALVLTVLECKGLEFQDVLLYNFFGSSPLRHEWRVVYEFMEQQNLLDSTSGKSFPNFDLTRHSLMCSELKHLYVAITRTRQRLWISENSDEFSMPVLEYWKKLGLVQVRVVDNSLIETMQVASSSQEWQRSYKGNFEMATLCFERAGDKSGQEMAKAYSLRAAASRLQDINKDEAQENLRKAAKLFVSIGKADLAAECFIDAGNFEDFKKAGKIYFEKGGKCDMRKAGECFRSARCHKLAAKSYAEGNHFAECLAVCMEENLLDKGLEYIVGWKSDPSVNSELLRVAHNFLEKSAIKNHACKNMNAMMEFVRAFDTIVLRRKFLRSVDCLYELLKLEEESGNFLEAAKIADELGNSPLQADLLFKAGLSKESTNLILWHVFANSLWSSGGWGWPLKFFPRKEDLLLKSKSIAAEEGGSFSELVYTEAAILSHGDHKISTLWQYFGASVQKQCVRGQFISLRKILDAHFQLKASKYVWGDELPGDMEKQSLQRILFNQMSAATLVHFWNHLSTLIVSVYKSVQGIDSKTSDDNDVVEFFLNYFGVRRHVNFESTRYRLLIPDAQWVERMNVTGSVFKCGKFSYVDKSVFVLAVRKYWQQELVSTSLKVLETLKVLYDLSERGSHSHFRQSMCLVYICKVTRFLQECELSYCKINERKKLQEFRKLSHEFIFKVFHLDWRRLLTRNMISLRQNQDTRELLSEIIRQITSTRSPLTYEQIGEVIMIFLGSGRFPDELHTEICGMFLVDEAWKDVIEVISQTGGSEPLYGNMQMDKKMKSQCYQEDVRRGRSIAQERISIIIKLQNALEATYCRDWQVINHYISPNCFIYLIDRLVLLASGFSKIFFTRKSSFTEWIMHDEPDTYHRSLTLLPDEHLSVQCAFDFTIKIIMELLFSIEDVAKWIRRSKTDPDSYLPLLFLRLIILVVLLCLNSGSYFHLLKQILDDDCIKFQLPTKFYDLLYHAICCGILDVSVVAEALETIGDPLVIVSFTKSSSQVTAPAAIFICMAEMPKKDEIFDVLFPKGTMNQYQGASDPLEVSCELSPVSESAEKSLTAVISSSIPLSINKESSIEGADMVFNWVCFEEIHDLLKAGEIVNQESFIRFDFEEKVEESLNCVTTAAALLSSNKCLSNGDINVTDELNNFLEDLNDLSFVLSSRNEELEENMRLIEQTLVKLLSRRPLLESLFNELLGSDEPVDWELESDAKCDEHEEINRESESTKDWDIRDPETETESEGRMQATGKRNGEEMADARAEDMSQIAPRTGTSELNDDRNQETGKGHGEE